MATIITNAAELQDIEDNPNGDYELGNDIDATGLRRIMGFSGTFDGKYCTIYNLTVPLFALVKDAFIQRVILDVDITAASDIGALVQNVSFDMTGTLTISRCAASGSVSGTSRSSSTGGLIGSLNDEDDCIYVISECFSSVDVQSELADIFYYGAAGGFIGSIRATIGQTTEERSVIQISDCYCNGRVFSSGETPVSLLGGFAGSITAAWGNEVTITNCYSSSAVTAVTPPTHIGGFYGQLNNYDYEGSYGTVLSLPSCYWDKESSGQSVAGYVWDSPHRYPPTIDAVGKTTAQMKTQTTFAGWDFDTIWQIADGVRYPALQWVIERIPATITTLAADQIGYAGQTARLNGSGGDRFDSNYFQYGQSATSLNLSTSPKAGTASFSEFITALNPAITYYFRAVGRTWNGLTYDYTYGEVLNFLSPGTADVINPHNYGYMWIEGTAIHLATESAGIEKAYLGEVV